MSEASDTGPSTTLTLAAVAEPLTWYAATPATADDRRHELEDEHTRLLAQAVGDHLPHELVLRASELAAELARGAWKARVHNICRARLGFARGRLPEL